MLMKNMIVSFNPSYYCNFRCDFCYLTEQQLSDRKLLDLKNFEKKLYELQEIQKITHIDFYGGEVALLPKNYFYEFKEICKKINPEININIITNLSVLPTIVYC